MDFVSREFEEQILAFTILIKVVFQNRLKISAAFVDFSVAYVNVRETWPHG